MSASGRAIQISTWPGIKNIVGLLEFVPDGAKKTPSLSRLFVKDEKEKKRVHKIHLYIRSPIHNDSSAPPQTETKLPPKKKKLARLRLVAVECQHCIPIYIYIYYSARNQKDKLRLKQTFSSSNQLSFSTKFQKKTLHC